MLNLIIVLVVSIMVTCINLSAIFTASEPTTLQTMASALFFIFWVLFSMYKGLNREKGFVRFITCFWCIGLLFSLTGGIAFIRFLSIVSIFLFTGPSYGVLYYYGSSYYDLPLIFISIFTPFILGLAGYFIGTKIGQLEYVRVTK